jgi:hypothetical protein
LLTRSQSVTLAKRLFIQAEGELGSSVIDHRGNVPIFRIVR